MWRPPGLSGTTHEKTPVTTRAALEVLNVIADEKLVTRADALWAWALERLHDIAKAVPSLRLQCGRGLLMGVEVADPDTGAPDPVRAKAIRLACLANGLNVKISARATIALSPLLIIEHGDLERAFTILARAARHV